jgi:hypothetical protein
MLMQARVAPIKLDKTGILDKYLASFDILES